MAAAVPIPMAAFAASLMEKSSKAIEIGQTADSIKIGEERSPAAAGGGSPLRRAIVLLVLTAMVAVAVPVFLLVRFHKHPMSQIWIMSVSICSYVFLLLRLWPTTRWFYTDFACLSYGLLLAFFSAGVIGSTTTISVLVCNTAWAAGYGGYSLALHRLRKGTEPAIHALPSPSRPISDCVERLNFALYTLEPVLLLLWTLSMALVVYAASLPDEPPDELGIFMTLLYFGCLHVSSWAMFVAVVPMHEVLVPEWTDRLVATLALWMMVSPLIYGVSKIIPVLSYFLLMVASVAFLWYNLAIYMHFLATATPSTTTQGNEETPSEAAATLPPVCVESHIAGGAGDGLQHNTGDGKDVPLQSLDSEIFFAPS